MNSDTTDAQQSGPGAPSEVVKEPSPSIVVRQKVAILIDGNNIERSVHHLMADDSAMLNFDLVVPKLLSDRYLNRLIYFREGKNISSKLAGRLHNLFYGQVQPCHKSADIPLSIKAMQLASKVDTIIIMSGDADYIELVSHLKSEGVRVEIAAVEESTAALMIEHANYFHPLQKEDFFVYQSAPSRSGGSNGASSSSSASSGGSSSSAAGPSSLGHGGASPSSSSAGAGSSASTGNAPKRRVKGPSRKPLGTKSKGVSEKGSQQGSSVTSSGSGRGRKGSSAGSQKNRDKKSASAS